MVERNCYFPARFVLAILGHCGILVAYTMRVNLSVGLVAMVNSTSTQQKIKMNPECDTFSGSSNTTSKYVGEFNWDEDTQGLILGSFFYGYLVTQLPGGLLATYFGGKWVFGIGILVTSVLTVLTPIVARYSVTLFIALRVVEGLGEVNSTAMGTLIALPISGVLCESTFLGGGIGVLWFIIWSVLITSSPERHARISEEELAFIIKERGSSTSQQRHMSVPWRSIFTSMPFWAIFVANVCNNWTFYTFLTSLPLYFKEVLNFPIQQNGFLSGVPFLVAWIVQVIAGQVADYLRFRRILSTTAVRKILGSIGFFIPAGLLIVTSYMGCSQIPAAVSLLALSVGLLACNNAAYSINHLDVAPNYAGVLQGITNSAGTVPGFIAPLVVGVLTENKPNREQWQKVLFIASGICTIGGIFYTIFSSGKEQSWNKLSKPINPDENSTSIEEDDDEDDKLLTP
eukprot:gene12121-13372_t